VWLAGWAVMGAIMALLWLVQKRMGDAGIVDVVWALGVGVLSMFYSALTDGLPERRVLIAILAGTWSLRLGGYLLARVMTMPEDGRYQKLRDEWGDATQTKLFWFFQLQAFWSALFAAPMLLAASNRQPLGLLDALGGAVWLMALLGESLADRQLASFRNNPANKGRVCRLGLWRYSRHPNYFFEWVHWWAYVLIGWQGAWGWLTLMGPATMLLFLFKITGIPPTEANALASRGDAYRAYQRSTSVFFPWPPKETTT